MMYLGGPAHFEAIRRSIRDVEKISEELSSCSVLALEKIANPGKLERGMAVAGNIFNAINPFNYGGNYTHKPFERQCQARDLLKNYYYTGALC